MSHETKSAVRATAPITLVGVCGMMAPSVAE